MQIRQRTRNIFFAVAVTVFVIISIGLYNSIDTKDQNKRAFVEREKVNSLIFNSFFLKIRSILFYFFNYKMN